MLSGSEYFFFILLFWQKLCTTSLSYFLKGFARGYSQSITFLLKVYWKQKKKLLAIIYTWRLCFLHWNLSIRLLNQKWDAKGTSPTWILSQMPVLSILLATLTAFPQMSYCGFLAPMTPATTGPTLIPIRILKWLNECSFTSSSNSFSLRA